MIQCKSSHPTKSIRIYFSLIALLFFMVSPIFLFSQEDEEQSSSRREANHIAAKNEVKPADKKATRPSKKRNAERFPTKEYETKQETYKTKDENSNFIALGGQYAYSQDWSNNNIPFHSAGGVIELESNFGNRYASLVNSFSANYIMQDETYINLSYLLAGRFYLASPYIYIDSGIEFIYSQSLDNLFDGLPGIAFNIAVGTTVPLTDTTSLQVKGFSRVGFGKIYKSFGVISALQFRV